LPEEYVSPLNARASHPNASVIFDNIYNPQSGMTAPPPRNTYPYTENYRLITQLRVLLTALVNLNPEFAEDVAAYIVGDDENNQQAADEVLASTIAALPDDKLTGFALRLVFTDYTAIPREGEVDFLAEAEVAA
jgi:hypothetical protein